MHFGCGCGEGDLLKFKASLKMSNKGDWSDFECSSWCQAGCRSENCSGSTGVFAHNHLWGFPRMIQKAAAAAVAWRKTPCWCQGRRKVSRQEGKGNRKSNKHWFRPRSAEVHVWTRPTLMPAQMYTYWLAIPLGTSKVYLIIKLSASVFKWADGILVLKTKCM